MGYRYKWKPSKAAAQEFAEQMKEITMTSKLGASSTVEAM